MKTARIISILSVSFITTLSGAIPALATPFHGSAQGSSVLGASTVSKVWSDLDFSPGAALNGGAKNDLFWQVGSSATLDTNSTFAGNIIAEQNATLHASAKVPCGRAIGWYAAKAKDRNIVANDCSNEAFGRGHNDHGGLDEGGGETTAGETTTAATIPEPTTTALLGFGLLGLFWRRRNSIQ
ncbi:MAG: ice-binding family protein [Pseudomonadota bacterium]